MELSGREGGVGGRVGVACRRVSGGRVGKVKGLRGTSKGSSAWREGGREEKGEYMYAINDILVLGFTKGFLGTNLTTKKTMITGYHPFL